jgi:uncharacterized protein YndB with AHSA1/START domain
MRRTVDVATTSLVTPAHRGERSPQAYPGRIRAIWNCPPLAVMERATLDSGRRRRIITSRRAKSRMGIDIGPTPRSTFRPMAATPESGFLVIADLTGYTAYLSGSEIEHAPAIAGDLLETIVGRLEPPFRLAKFEGDAAFLFAEDGRADGSLLLDAIEASYLAFRRRLRSIDQATTCDCNSCRLAPRLDLKVFIHHGAFVWSRIAGRDELAGSDVIVVHRLLKGGAVEARANGFALFTTNAVDALGLDPEALGLRSGEESIEHLGHVDTFTLDLEARWQAESGERRLEIAESDAAFDLEATFAAEPSVVWAHLTSPALRTRWEGQIVITEASAGGHRGVGTTAQCVTGRLATLEEIIDWQPYDRVAWQLAVPGVGPVAASADLDPTETGTHVRLRWAYQGGIPADEGAVERLRADKEAAYARLATIITGALPVVEWKEGRS